MNKKEGLREVRIKLDSDKKQIMVKNHRYYNIDGGELLQINYGHSHSAISKYTKIGIDISLPMPYAEICKEMW